MPLNKTTVTVASRVMLPTYVVFFAGLGINYSFTPTDRIQANPALKYTAHIMPLPAWGGLFVACAIIMAVAILLHRRTPYRFALLLCALSMTLWAASNIAAAFQSSATAGGWLWPAFIVAACIASYRSLSIREV